MRDVVGDLQALMRLVSYAHMAISTRFLAPSLFMRLARWVLTVLRLMWSSLAISALVRPRATVTMTSSSRVVRGSIGWRSGSLVRRSAKAASRRTVTLGAISASPLAAAWTAWLSSSGPASLSRKPRAPRLERAVHVLVEVERGDDHHRERIFDARPGQRAGRAQPVKLGHPDVQQAHIGLQLPGQRYRLPTVARLGHDLDVGLSIQDHAQPGADELLVVGDEHADGHRAGRARGSTASTPQPWSGPGPASRVPPRSAARSVIPTTP